MAGPTPSWEALQGQVRPGQLLLRGTHPIAAYSTTTSVLTMNLRRRDAVNAAVPQQRAGKLVVLRHGGWRRDPIRQPGGRNPSCIGSRTGRPESRHRVCQVGRAIVRPSWLAAVAIRSS